MSYPNKGLSIDLGNDKIKIIEYKRSRDKVKVRRSLLIDTPDNCMDDGLLTNMESVAEAIRDALKQNNIKEKKVIFTVASGKIITREVDLPDLPKKKLDALIQMNAEEYFPVDLFEYTTDYRILDHYVDGDDKMIRVNMVAALTELMESYINLGGVLGLKVLGVDFAGNSIVNYASNLKKSGTYLLLDLGSNSTMVTIMSDNTVRFNRNLVYGSSVVISSIQKHFNVRYKEAVKISGEQSLLKEDPAEDDYLANEVTSALNQVLSGVSRLVDFYTSRNKDGIEKIYLVGGGTSINGIVEYITAYFNVESEVVVSAESVSSDDEDFKENMVYYANSLGAVFSDMNLLPKEFINQDKKKAENRVRLEVGLLLLLLLGGAMYLPYMSIQGLEKEKAVLENEIEEKKVVEEVKAAYDAALVKESFYTNLENSSSSTTEIILSIIETMEVEIPSGVDYLSMNNTEEGLIISCVAEDKLVLVNFMAILKSMTLDDLPVFDRVYIPSYTNPEIAEAISEEDEGYYAFTIMCDYTEGVSHE